MYIKVTTRDGEVLVNVEKIERVVPMERGINTAKVFLESGVSLIVEENLMDLAIPFTHEVCRFKGTVNEENFHWTYYELSSDRNVTTRENETG